MVWIRILNIFWYKYVQLAQKYVCKKNLFFFGNEIYRRQVVASISNFHLKLQVLLAPCQ